MAITNTVNQQSLSLFPSEQISSAIQQHTDIWIQSNSTIYKYYSFFQKYIYSSIQYIYIIESKESMRAHLGECGKVPYWKIFDNIFWTSSPFLWILLSWWNLVILSSSNYQVEYTIQCKQSRREWGIISGSEISIKLKL